MVSLVYMLERVYMPIFRTFAHCMFCILVLGISLIGCSKKIREDVKPVSITPFTYDKYEIDTGTAKNQTILSGFLLGGTVADIAVVNIDGESVRNLSVYTFRNSEWELELSTTLRQQVLFVDIAHIDGRDRLITYEPGRLNWFDIDSDMERVLIDIKINFNELNANKIPQIDITRDLNGDGRDDLVLPNIDGFWIATQMDSGVFSEPIKVGPPDPFLDEKPMDESRSYREVGINTLTVFWYLSRLHQMDYDRDGRIDLVFWNEAHFDVYLQRADGTFSTDVVPFTVDVQFDTDGAYAIAFAFSGENLFSLMFGFRENSKHKMLHMFRDFNSDGVADMVIHTLEGRSLGKQHSLYQVHFGKKANNGTKFSQDVDLTIRPTGKAGGLLPWGYAYQWWQDIDGDGQIDIMFKDVKTAVGGMVRAMVGNSIPIDLAFFRMEEGKYPHKPTITRRLRPALEIFNAQGVFFPVVLLGDVNGDNLSDLIVGKNWSEMNVYLGIPGPKLLTRKPQKVMVTMPHDERNMRLVDLNKDNKQDILIYHPSSSEPHRVVMLMTS